MNCRFADFRCKEVINICDGCRLGYVGDVECRLPDGQLTAPVSYTHLTLPTILRV